MSIYDPSQTPIAIVGVSAVFPGSVDKTGFWNDILAGNDLITDIPASHWLIDDYYDEDKSAPDKTYAKRGAFLESVPFDPMEWGVPPSIVPATDTTQLLALIVAKRVLEDAVGAVNEADLSRTSVILGVTSAQELLGTMVNRLQRPVWVKALRELGYAEGEVNDICNRIGDQYVPWQESTFPGLLGNVVAGRIANRLDLGGTNCVTDAACASSFSAINMAVNELWLGQSDMVVAGGCDTMNDIFMYMCFSKTPALSPTGECAPFSDKADGTLLGEGLGMVALKRLPDAERDGDQIYAVLKGIGSSSDGRSKSVYAPVPKGQSKALIRAYDQAGYGADTVELVEAHGTGTKAGDAAEFGGLRLAFEAAGRDDKQWCALGTVKSQIGHTKAAAGAAGLFKVVMALHHKVLPPTIKIDKPNPSLDIDNSPFHLNTVARPWIRPSDHPRRGSVSSFGFGGSNFHLALEEYLGSGEHPTRTRTMPTELVLLGADSPAALAKEARAWAERSTCDGFLVYAARTTQASFSADSAARLAVVVRDEAELTQRLQQAADRIDKAPDASFSIPTGMHYAAGKADPGKVAFLFPGQGSQYLRMGADVAMHYDEARMVWDHAADTSYDGRSLHQVVHPVPVFDTAAEKAQVDTLRATEWAQPAIGLVSLSHLALLAQLGLRPDMVAGHSYGEISALHAAGVLTADDMLAVARKRGELMAAAAVNDGAMTAVPAELEVVRPYADAVDGAVLANHNHPKQVVVSGPTAAIDALEAKLLADGIEPKRLKVATAFHSPVVSDSAEPFAAFLESINFRAPKLPCFHNPEATPYGDDPTQIRRQLAQAIARPVRFVEQIERMYEAGVRTFVEVGPGHVLTNLVGEILGKRAHHAVNLDRRKKHGITVLHNALGQLALAGLQLNLDALWESFAAAVDPHTLPQPKLRMDINGSNYGKPYPPAGGAAALPKPNPVRTGAAKALEPKPQVVEKVVEKVVEVEKIVEVPVAAAPGQAMAAPAAAHALSPRAPSPTPVATATADDAWVAAFQQVQQATVDAHATYQQSMASSHMAFLQTVEASLGSLGTMLGGQPATARPAAPTTSFAPPPAAAPAPVPDWTPQPVASSQDVSQLVQSGIDVVRPKAAAPAAPVAPAVAPAAQAAGLDLTALLMGVVADKTGYPSEMLAPHMSLESDLGIDSIKRVEILSAMREQAPGLPEVDAAEMAGLATLGQIVDHMQAQLGTSAPAAAPVAPTGAAQGWHTTVDVSEALMAVVADKTGYPSEMLAPHMNLESDLGIDSIKRVEILSAMREAVPGLPEVDAAEMAGLQTLGQIVDHMQAQLGGAAPAPAAATPAAPAPVAAAAPASAPAVDLHGLLMSVVADKTGYPADMLAPHMNLESDLGIDSIKRVEILSAMREQAPSLPEVDAGAMASLQTLGQIIDHMQAQLGPAAAPAAAAPAAAPAVDLHGLLMSVVADKTGYPADMLAPHMNLESDLGIDSIKRVEILSAMREQAPSLPEVDAGAMASLQTLGQIIDHMQAQLGPAAAPAAAAPAAAPAVDLHGLLMSVVADKTGYPADMLAPHMNLESDLGIDSIKRVEILSAMREQAPSLPEVDAGAMASLQTLGQIIDHMQAQLGPAAAPAAAAPAAAPAVDLHGLLMSVVADKTGYPADMLAPHMNLESDLGIDSIKRVEILSAMREQAPSLPEVDAGAMASLQTLGQIIEYMQGQLGGAAAAAPVGAVSVVAEPAGPELGRWALQAVATPAAGLSQPGLSPDATIVVLGDDAVAPALVASFAARGLAATLVDTVPADADAVVFTGGLRADGADQVAAEAFAAARSVAKRFSESQGLFITVQDTGGRFQPTGERAWFGGLPGLTKTAAQEWAASTKAIDLERGERSPSDLADAIVSELLGGGHEAEVGLAADGTRYTLQSVRRDALPTAPATDGDSVIVATGGARGVTAATLIRLAQERGGRFALLGRTPLTDEPAAARGVEGDAKLKGALLGAAKASGTMPTPAELGKQVSRILAGREVRATLAALEAAGAEAIYVPTDVADEAATKKSLADVRARFGPITGLVHGAGVLADRFIADKTDDQFAFVYGVKVGGLRTLLSALADDPLTAIVMFSSVAGRCGNQGQCDYAMANEVLNKVAVAEQARRGDACVVKSLGWGPWEGGMVTPQLKAHFAALGVPLIPLDEGAQMLVDDLADRSGDVEVVLGGEPKMGPLAAAHGERSVALRVHVSEASHGYLADHTIAGVPVVPMVLAVEWMARAAHACRPDLQLASLTDVSVNSGIKLDHFAEGHWFDVSAREISNGTGAVLAVTITDLRGRRHYSATAQLTEERATAPKAPAEASGLSSFEGSIYDGHILFHGSTFQVLKELEGISDKGIVARSVTTTPGAGWSDEPWQTDPAAFDGGLQMALLWSQRVLGGASIPMKLGAVRSYTQGPTRGPVRAALTGAVRGRDKTVADIVFTDASGEVVAELQGVEAILRPGEPARA